MTPLRPLRSSRRSRADADREASDEKPEAEATAPRPGSRPSPAAVVRRITGPFQTVVAAVYAALADPLVNAPPEVREKRAAQVRRIGIAVAGTALALILIYATFPVRTYLDLRSATQRREQQIETINRANEELEERKRDLNDPETVEQMAREDYGMVLPGEEPYAVLPAPETTTTTVTAPG